MIIQSSMERKLRIKKYLHILESSQVVDFIKTLYEGIQLPSANFFDVFLECIHTTGSEAELLSLLSEKLNVPVSAARQLLDKLLEMGILEYAGEEIPLPLNRYHRQLLLYDAVQPKKKFDENFQHQEKLRQTHILIMGIGGIGNFMATSLVASGVGKITLVDFDTVEQSNLNRQILFSENDLGKNKVDVAANRLKEMNSSCEIVALQRGVSSQRGFEILLEECRDVNYVVLSADRPVDLVLWASMLCKKYLFKYIKCGYMAYQGLIGPLLGYHTKPYEEIFLSWANSIRSQKEHIQEHNENHIAPSMAPTNAILANIAAWELVKDITGIAPSVLTEKRILFNLKTMEMIYG